MPPAGGCSRAGLAASRVRRGGVPQQCAGRRGAGTRGLDSRLRMGSHGGSAIARGDGLGTAGRKAGKGASLNAKISWRQRAEVMRGGTDASLRRTAHRHCSTVEPGNAPERVRGDGLGHPGLPIPRPAPLPLATSRRGPARRVCTRRSVTPSCTSVLCPQFFKQCFGRLEVGRGKALGKLPIHGLQEGSGCGGLALLLP